MWDIYICGLNMPLNSFKGLIMINLPDAPTFHGKLIREIAGVFQGWAAACSSSTSWWKSWSGQRCRNWLATWRRNVTTFFANAMIYHFY